MSDIQLSLLGGVNFCRADGTKVNISSTRGRALVSALGLAADGFVSRERAIDLFWGNRAQEQAFASLRQTLSQLRRELNVQDEDIVIADRFAISITCSDSVIDAKLFSDLCKSSDMAELERAAELYKGPPLADIRIEESAFFEWQRAVQNKFEENYRQVLNKLLNRHLKLNNTDVCREYAQKLLDLDHADEKAHRALMRVHARAGNLSLVHQQYQQCAASLKQEYDAAPSSETINLLNVIRAGERDYPVSAIPPAQESGVQTLTEQSGAQTCICVLPLQCASNDVDAERVSSELSRDLLVAISRFRWIATKSSGTTLLHRMHGMSAASIAQLIGARFAVDGHLRRRMNSITITVELIDVISDTIVWTERFTAEIGANEEYSDRLISKLACRMEVRLRGYEANRASQLPLEGLGAQELALRGLRGMYALSPNSYEEANNLFERARRLIPHLSVAYSWNALWDIFCYGQGWDLPQKSTQNSPGNRAREAINCDPEDAMAVAICGHEEAFVLHQYDYAEELFERALHLNPHAAFIWMMSSATCSYTGQPREALRRLDIADEICPVEPHFRFMYNSARCIANLVDQNYEEAGTWGRKTARENPTFSNGLKQLLVSLGHLGEIDEAKKYITQLLSLEPDFDAVTFAANYSLKRLQDRESFLEGLHLVGFA